MSRLSTPFRYIRENVFRVGTQADFADMLGYTQAQVSRLERGERRISRDAQDRIRGLASQKKIPWNDSWFFEVPNEERAA